ncbi:MAG: FHA domain-containing protein [Proteobacteria bacterium]|nr:FHA domain-containing protein [Pseudomonadota bacterium]
MGKLVVSLDNVVLKEVTLTQDRTTVGRRPYNDIVIDNLAVSGEHAVLLAVGAQVFVEDLGSTNGTYLNGKAIKKHLMAHGDVIEVGKYRLKYLLDESTDYEKTMVLRPGSLGQPPAVVPPRPYVSPPPPPLAQTLPASIKVVSGPATGREVLLTKVVTTVGKPGAQVASIAKRPSGYVLAHVEGELRPTVNGQAVGNDAVALKNGDLIELAGTQMQFIQG